MEKLQFIFQKLNTSSQPIIISSNKIDRVSISGLLGEILKIQETDIVNFEPSEGIKVLREDISKLNMRPFGSGLKILLVSSAELLTDVEANTLLKTMEEPPSYARIILLATSLAKLLPTIKSRCLKYVLVENKLETSLTGFYKHFEKKSFVDFTAELNKVENEEYPGLVSATLDEMKQIGLNKDTGLLYEKLANIFIKISNSNISPKLALENLFIWWKAQNK